MQKIIAVFASAALFGLVGCQDGAAEKKTDEAPATVKQVAEAPAPAKAEEPELVEVTPDQVEGWMTEKAKVAVFDANGPDTRASQGVVPGAVLLTSYRELKAEELPSDKDTKLVFYCGSTSCSASDRAAENAVEKGYSDVCVMRAGIKGWKKAGKKTLTLAEAEKAAGSKKG